MSNSKKILVTGSLGFIGSVLMPFLRSKGHKPLGYDVGYFRGGTFYNTDDGETISGHMADFDSKLLDGVDAVVHLAGISNDPFGNLTPEKVYDPSRLHSKKLGELCKERGIKFVFASSCSVYGKAGEEFVDETSDCSAQTPYSVNKLQIEEDLIEMSDEHFNPVMFRFATLYGLSPRMRFDIVINMLTGMALTRGKVTLNSDGQAWRPYVHINDVMNAILLGIETNIIDAKPAILNVGETSGNMKIIDVAKLICSKVPGCELEFLGKKSSFSEQDELIRDRKVQDGVDTRTYRVSFERIKNVFPSFKCEWGIERGIDEMISKFQEIGLDETMFTRKEFYRLQQMEYLHGAELITDDMRWKKN